MKTKKTNDQAWLVILLTFVGFEPMDGRSMNTKKIWEEYERLRGEIPR